MDDFVALACMFLAEQLQIDFNDNPEDEKILKNDLSVVNRIARQLITKYSSFFRRTSKFDVDYALELLNREPEKLHVHYFFLVNYLLDLEDVYDQLLLNKPAPKVKQRKKKP